MEDDLLVRVGAGPAAPDPPGDRSAGKRAAIVRAATELFLRHGYQGTSTEQIATAAAVSKQTVYHQFGDKQRLFRDILLGVTATAEAFADGLAGTLADVARPEDVEPALRDLARRYLAAVMSPQVLALRRLVIAEATRFPDLAATYWDRAPGRVLAALADVFADLSGLVTVDDPARAAADFAFLVLGRPLDHGMFHPGAATTDDDVAVAADHAVDVFLAAHPVRRP